MFIRRKTYNALVEQKDDFERIASKAITQNGRLLDQCKEALEEMKDIQSFNRILVDRNEELLARIEQLEETARRAVCEKDEMIDDCLAMQKQLDTAIKQRDYYYNLLGDTIDAYEEGKAISREAEE